MEALSIMWPKESSFIMDLPKLRESIHSLSLEEKAKLLVCASSLNHYSKGALSKWLLALMALINIDGENSFLLKPIIGGKETLAIKPPITAFMARFPCHG